MGKFIDLTGRKFGRLTVSGLHSMGKRTFWDCTCECGNTKVVGSYDIQTGHTSSCGCFRKEHCSRKATKHGFSRHLLYNVYSGMIDRCYNKNIEAYKDYGGRGITVCEEWRSNNILFFEWALKNGWQKGLHIDREDNYKGYSPDNCRFVTKVVNANNKRSNLLLEYNGKMYGTHHLSQISGLTGSQILCRIRKHGWTVEKAINTPLRTSKNKHYKS